MKFLFPVISLILCLFILFSACDTKSDFSGNINTDVNSDSRIGDSLALVELYNKCNGPVWKTTWDLSEPINNWYGIYLKYGRVVYVNLDDNNLSGTLPDDIANISELEHLYLNNNNLSGELPSFISRMKKLITLYLGENYFTGTITQEYIDFASKMNTRLRIDANFITGNVPEGMIYENINTTYRYQYHTKDINKENRLIDILQTISCNQADSLALNALYEANPEAFDWNTAEYVSGWCNRDIILTIKDNKLFVSGIEIYNVESIPKEIKNLKHIKSLVLNYYFRTGFQEVILELSSLEYLKMFGTGIIEIPQNIDKLPE